MLGRTPLLSVDGQLFLKLEGCNPSGSLRDRAIFPLIAAQNQPERTLLLADWGPFALSAAWAATLLKRKLELWLPADAPMELLSKLQSYDLQLHQIPLPLKELRQQIRQLAELRSEQYQLLDPSIDPEHPMAYCEHLAPELWEQMNGNISAIVSGCEHCACLMGCSTYFKQKNPNILAVAAPISQDFYGNCDPLGNDPEFYVPQLCDLLSYCALSDAQNAQKELFQKTGIPCGIIGGAAYHAAKELQKELDGKIIVILPSRYDCF